MNPNLEKCYSEFIWIQESLTTDCKTSLRLQWLGYTFKTTYGSKFFRIQNDLSRLLPSKNSNLSVINFVWKS